MDLVKRDARIEEYIHCCNIRIDYEMLVIDSLKCEEEAPFFALAAMSNNLWGNKCCDLEVKPLPSALTGHRMMGMMTTQNRSSRLP